MRSIVSWTLFGCAVAWSPFTVAQTPVANAATATQDTPAAIAARACSELVEPMPYTVERTDQVIQLQLSVIGLRLDETNVPPIVADASISNMRRETVGAMTQAMDRVARVHFCRLAKVFPDRKEEIELAQDQFIDDLTDAFTASNFESLATASAARTVLLAGPKPTFRAPQADLNRALLTENFTRVDMTAVEGGVEILGFASVRGCRDWVQQSAAQASGVFLVALADLKPLIVRYLTSDSRTGTARRNLLLHAKAAYESNHSNQIVQTLTPTLTTCLTETAQRAREVLPPVPEAPAQPEETAAPTGSAAPTAPTSAPAVPT